MNNTALQGGGYIWVSDWSAKPAEWTRLQYAAYLAARLKMRVLRLPMGYAAVDPFDNMLPMTTPNFLKSTAHRPDWHTLFSTPGIETFMLTTYTAQAYNQTGNWSGIDLTVEYNEYRALAEYLAINHPSKRFIILPWETDNEPVTESNVDLFVAMTIQRVRGIQDSGASNVLSGLEFAHTDDLVLPRVKEIRTDLISFTLWEVTSPLISNPNASTLASDLQAKLELVKSISSYPANRIMIGEAGYHPSTVLPAGQWIKTVWETAAAFGCPYFIYWNLLEDGNGYGAFNAAGEVRPIGRYASIFNHLKPQ